MDTIILRIQTDFKKNPVLENLIKELSQKYNLNLDTSRANASVSSLGEKIKSSFSNMTTGFMKADLALGGISRAFQIVKSIGDAVTKPADEMEQLRLRLVSLYQSTDKANEAFDKFRDIAARTPATLQQVVEAGASLKAFGMNAEDTLASVSDLAAYMGMDVVEAASAVGRAFAGGAGAADILRERGVLELIKSFKGIDDLTKLSLPEFRKVLIETLQSPASGIAGSADRIAKSYAGAMSNLDDSLTNLKALIGNHLNPVIASLARGLTDVINNVLSSGDAFEIATKKANDQRIQFELLAMKVEDLGKKTNRTKEENVQYQAAVNDIVKFAPNYISKIDTSKTSFNQVAEAIDKARVKLNEYLVAQVQMEMVNQDDGKLKKRMAKTAEYQAELNKLNAGFRSGVLSQYTWQTVTPAGGTQTESYVTKSNEYQRQQKLITIIKDRTAEENNLNAALQNRINALHQLYGSPTPPKTDTSSASSSLSIASTTATPFTTMVNQMKKDLMDEKQLIEEEKRLRDETIKKELPIPANGVDKNATKRNAALDLSNQVYLHKLDEFNQKQADLDKQIADKKLQEQTSYYEQVKFLDSGYYNWKLSQITAEVRAMAISSEQQDKLIKQRKDALDAEQKTWQNPSKQQLLDGYNAEISRLADLKAIGALTYDELTAKMQLYADKIKAAFGSQSAEYKAALDAMQTAQIRIGEKLASEWRKQNSTFLSGWNSVSSTMVAGFDSAWSSILDVQMSGKHRSEQIWDSMRDHFMSSVGQMASHFIEKKFQELAVTLTVEKSKQVAILTSLGIEKSSLIASIALGIKNAFAGLFQAIGNVWKSLTSTLGVWGVPVAIGTSGVMIAAFEKIKASIGFAHGGEIKGSGSSTSDNIPILASPGEFIVNARSVAMPGVLSLLHTINRFQTPALSFASQPGHYASGGLISTGNPTISMQSISELIQEVKLLRKDIFKAQPTIINHAPNPIEIYKQGETGRKLYKGY